MTRLVPCLMIVLFSTGVYAECDRLTLDDNYEDINSILDCIEARIPERAILNDGAVFIPGDYIDSEGIHYLVSSGGNLGPDRTTWSLQSRSKSRIFNAGWTTGPAVGHPQIGGMDVASKLPKNVSYGVIGKETYQGWKQGGLIGVTQSGDSITIWAYHLDKTSTPILTHAVNSLVLTRVIPSAK